MAPCYLAGAMQTASNIRTTLAFRTATNAPANVTHAAWRKANLIPAAGQEVRS